MAANFGSDPWLDARLRNVPLPVGMLARLSQAGSPTDEQLDSVVRDVPVPEGLCLRLQQITDLPQRRIDWLTVDLAPRVLTPVHWARQHIGWRELAIAASLLLAVGAGYVTLAARFFSQPAQHDGPFVVDNSVDPDAGGLDATTDELATDLSDSSREFADDPSLGTPGSGDSLFPPIDFKPLPLPGPRVRRSRDLLFAADGAIDRLPPLETVSQPANRGLATPLVASYDLLAHLKSGERSFVSPNADPQWVSTLIPLGHDTSSYRLAQQYVSQGQLPPPEDVRIEDFLAAQGDHYPPVSTSPVSNSPAENNLVIRVAAGPSPLGEPGLRLLQVGVQAGRSAGPPRPATDLTIAVDTSASMRHGRRLEMVRSAIRRLVSELTPADRLTLIGFSDDAELLADHLRIDRLSVDAADHAAIDRLLAAVDHLVPDSGTNVGAGIALASDAILGSPSMRDGNEPGSRRQLVLFSDGLAELGSEARGRIGTLLRSLSTAGVKFNVLDVSGDAEVSGPLADLAAAGEGHAQRATDADEISVALGEALAGAPQTVARSASLEVAFNPQVVHSYRLVGHATTTITGPASAATQVDLHSGEQAAGLFEIWLQPGGGDDVATAELTWHDPVGAGSQKHTQRISRLQFAKSFAESPLSLQAAVIATEAARALRSHSTTPARSLTRVIDLASQANPLLRESESFRQLVALVGQADKLRSSGTTVRRAGNSPKP